MVVNFEDKYTKDINNIYNVFAKRVCYKILNCEEFNTVFVNNEYFAKEHTFVLLIDDKVQGFICGCTGDSIPKGDVRGYITCLALADEFNTQENSAKLLQKLEQSFAKKGKQQCAVTFFNPMRLSWVIKGTQNHVHNNAPGIPTDTELYSIMQENAYKTITTECAMYMDLASFYMPQSIAQKESELAKKGYTFEFYNSSKHKGLTQMLDALNSEEWSTVIPKAAEQGEKVLVALDGNMVAGFTGPIYPEPSGRGYFAGIGIAPNWQGKKLGTVLFYKLCQAEKDCGGKYMSLFTGKENPAQRIYSGAGFRVVREFAVMLKEIQG